MTVGKVPKFTSIRRVDRAVTDEKWIKDYLTRAPYGVLGLCQERQPYIHPNLFVYDDAKNVIYLHTASEGRTYSIVKQNDKICFSVMEMGRLLPAKAAPNFSVEYASVTIFGQISIVTDEAECKEGLQMLLDKYFPHLKPGDDYRPTQNEDLAEVSVYRIEIDSWSGKQKLAPVEFPGAFRNTTG